MPEPDEKDWTWTLTRPCPQCGFDAETVERFAIGALVRDATSRWYDVLERPSVAVRPAPTTWSPLEYACHVRDVCQVFTTRLRLMLDLDHPRFDTWDQDATAVADRYWEQSPALVSGQLREAADGLATAYEAVGAADEDDWTRTGLRSNGSQFTTESLGRYLLHDLYHHVWDVRA